jgi:hypothetical protein
MRLAVPAVALLVSSPSVGLADGLVGQLQGTELLIELRKVGPGPELPGIYALDEDGQLRRIAAYAHDPRWSQYGKFTDKHFHIENGCLRELR